MYNVLVADDHAIVRSGISYLVDLQPNFTVVDGTASGTDTYIRVEQGGIDILIMDLSMPPGENGLITTRRIHDKFPKVKIIILSMHNLCAVLPYVFRRYLDDSEKNDGKSNSSGRRNSTCHF